MVWQETVQTSEWEGHQAYLQSRIREVASYDRRTAERCGRGLLACADESDDPAVLESLFFLGLGQPKLAARLEFSAQEAGQRLAGHYEDTGDPARAIAILQCLADAHPENRVLERQFAGAMRSHGLVSDLVERYMDRARESLRRGRVMEAIPWLQEILLTDRSRRDVARLIRDLRNREAEGDARSKRRAKLAVAVLVLLGAASGVFLRAQDLQREYRAVVAEVPTELVPMRAQLAALESFASDHPLWHGVFDVDSARESLRSRIDLLETGQRQQEEARRRNEELTLLRAEMARQKGMAFAEVGDMEASLAELRGALELAGEGWSERDQVERDVAAITDWLEGRR